MPSSEKMDILWQHHYEIFKAIKQRDPETSKKKVIEHLDYINEKLKEDMGTIKN
jgi:DNA-binding FadR family transcriptional regulator